MRRQSVAEPSSAAVEFFSFLVLGTLSAIVGGALGFSIALVLT